MTIRVLFVCLGNICRSPLAEGVFQYMVDENGLGGNYQVRSAGTSSLHVGESADPRMRKTARTHGIELISQARPFRLEDFDRFDLIVALDRHNRDYLLRLARRQTDRGKIRLLREFDLEADGNLDVPDPYYGGARGFEDVYQIVKRSSQQLLQELKSG